MQSWWSCPLTFKSLSSYLSYNTWAAMILHSNAFAFRLYALQITNKRTAEVILVCGVAAPPINSTFKT